MKDMTTTEKLDAIIALLKDGDEWREDVGGADFVQEVSILIDAPTTALRLWLYRVLDTDDEGDPLDHGPVLAVDLARAKKLVKAHLLTLGTFGWDGGALRVRFYDCGAATLTEGVPKSEGDFADVTIRATKKEVEANPE